MDVLERFLKYIKIDTQSSEEGVINPTTNKQFDLANILVEDLKKIGIENAYVDEKCYVYGSIPASECYENKPKIGLIAHMDTAPDYCGENVEPIIVENYNGKTLKLGNSDKILSVDEFEHLESLKGRTLITTSGKTLLGADDKAGIAEIIAACEKIMSNNIPHGKISVCFTPDEEVGMGADGFDLKVFDSDFAYTVDGGAEGEIVYETFNAASAKITIYGKNIHPGSAKNIMKNASLISMEFNELLPRAEIPSTTEKYEGFYHLCGINGNIEKAEMYYIIRDHDNETFNSRIKTINHVQKFLNEKYGDNTVDVEIKEQYKNMKEVIVKNFEIVENSIEAIRSLGLEPSVSPIRGGTDGARLSFMGLPCPNLGTGGYCFHGPYEHITKEGMEISVKIIIETLKNNWK